MRRSIHRFASLLWVRFPQLKPTYSQRRKMKYQAVIAMLPRLLRAEDAADYVGGETMLKELAVEPFSRRKGSTLYDRVDLDRAIDARKYAGAAEALRGR